MIAVAFHLAHFTLFSTAHKNHSRGEENWHTLHCSLLLRKGVLWETGAHSTVSRWWCAVVWASISVSISISISNSSFVEKEARTMGAGTVMIVVAAAVAAPIGKLIFYSFLVCNSDLLFIFNSFYSIIWFVFFYFSLSWRSQVQGQKWTSRIAVRSRNSREDRYHRWDPFGAENHEPTSCTMNVKAKPIDRSKQRDEWKRNVMPWDLMIVIWWSFLLFSLLPVHLSAFFCWDASISANAVQFSVPGWK